MLASMYGLADADEFFFLYILDPVIKTGHFSIFPAVIGV
jgi:hypothetical protein